MKSTDFEITADPMRMVIIEYVKRLRGKAVMYNPFLPDPIAEARAADPLLDLAFMMEEMKIPSK